MLKLRNIFYQIKYFLVLKLKTDKKLTFHIKGEKNAFYMIQYQLKFDEEELKIINYLESGLNYIESIDIDKDEYKYIKIHNSKSNQNLPFLVNFYSLNCDLKVSREILINGKYKNINCEIIILINITHYI